MATAKKTRPAAKKSVPVKQVSKKPVKGKPVAKPSATSKKTSPVKSKTVEKSKSSTISKKLPAVKPEIKKTKAIIPVPQKKTIAKSAVKVTSSAKAPAKKEIVPVKPSAKTPEKKEIVTAKPSAKAPEKKQIIPVIASAKAPEKNEIVPSQSSAKKEFVPAKVTAQKTVPVKAETKSAVVTKQDKTPAAKEVAVPSKKVKAQTPVVKQDEKLDPLHVKAAKAMKELEETMDLSKVRPRIQAGTPTPAPKPPSKHVAPPLKLVEPTNTSKIKFQLEFEFRASPKILYNYLRDPDGLAGWFADEVKTKDNIFTFIWEGSESYAKLVASKDQHLVRFQWTEETDGTYFQFEIKEDDITADVALIITDFANPGEKDTNARLWESQVQKLRLLLGSF